MLAAAETNKPTYPPAAETNNCAIGFLSVNVDLKSETPPKDETFVLKKETETKKSGTNLALHFTGLPVRAPRLPDKKPEPPANMTAERLAQLDAAAHAATAASEAQVEMAGELRLDPRVVAGMDMKEASLRRRSTTASTGATSAGVRM
jgi:hypothetical protein